MYLEFWTSDISTLTFLVPVTYSYVGLHVTALQFNFHSIATRVTRHTTEKKNYKCFDEFQITLVALQTYNKFSVNLTIFFNGRDTDELLNVVGLSKCIVMLNVIEKSTIAK